MWKVEEDLCIESLFSQKADKKFWLHLQAFGTVKQSDRIQKMKLLSFSLPKGPEVDLFCDSLPQGRVTAAAVTKLQ